MANNDDWTHLEVEGLAELDEKLKGLTNDLAGKALFGALNVALTPMVKTAKERATVAEKEHILTYKSGWSVKVQPGLLRSAIRKRRLPKSEHVGEFSQGAVMGVYVGKGTKQKVFPFYWHFIEYGTAKIPAAPYIRPGFDNNVDIAIKRFADKLSQNIDKYTEN